jgi:hypothetical protein
MDYFLIGFVVGAAIVIICKLFQVNYFYIKGVRDGYTFPDEKNPRFDMIREIVEDVPRKSIDDSEDADWWKRGERR